MAHGYPDFEGDKRGLYLQPAWAAVEGTDKNLTVVGGNVVPGGNITLVYNVPAGKTLYITDLHAASSASTLAADGELNQIIYAVLTSVTIRFRAGGNGGFAQALSKPTVFVAGSIVAFQIFNVSGHNCSLSGGMMGYEA